MPGILGLLFYKGSTGKALSDLGQTLLHGPSGLSSGERELIASYVSRLNDCNFCHSAHSAAATAHLGDGGAAVQCVIENVDEAPVSEKMKALLRLAAKVQQSGKAVTPEDIEHARSAGASDEDIHDAVLVAAAFCMFNRYVDGLGTDVAEEEEYPGMGTRLATKGYGYPPRFMRKFIVRMMNRQARKKREAAGR